MSQRLAQQVDALAIDLLAATGGGGLAERLEQFATLAQQLEQFFAVQLRTLRAVTGIGGQ
ncbi:hypothetical protein D3C85_1787530 [compost metagenome]